MTATHRVRLRRAAGGSAAVAWLPALSGCTEAPGGLGAWMFITVALLAATLGVSAIALRNARPVDGILLVTQAFFITIIVAIMDYSGRHKN